MAKEVEEIEVEAAGHSEPLFVTPSGTASCGDIRDGVVFRFGRTGSWVLSLADLEKICAAARKNSSEEKS